MGRLSEAVMLLIIAGFCWIMFFAYVAKGQPVPTGVLCVAEDQYALCTPAEVVEAGGGSDTPYSTATPKVEQGAGAPGTQDAASRGDHVHPLYATPLSAFGTVGTSGQCAKANSSRDGLSYGDCGSPRTLSNFNPRPPGTVAPGTRTDVSRADHVHPLQAVPAASDANPQPPGTAAPGTRTDVSRADHVHPLQAVPAPATQAPLVEGTPQVGTSTLYARQDHRHPAAGGGGGAGVTAYKFFALETLTVPPITTTTQIMPDAPRTWTAVATKTFSGGLIPGPFVTAYEGGIHITLNNAGTLSLTVAVKHTFPSINKSLTSSRTMQRRLAGGEAVTFDLNALSSTTVLATGNVTADDGTTINITTNLLADPVQVGITMTLTAIGSNERIASLNSTDARVAFWQLESTAPPTKFIGLEDTPSAYTGQAGKLLAVNPGANAVIFQDAPTGFPGYATVIHTTGTANAPGSSGKVARGDHVHATAAPPSPYPAITGNAKSVLSVKSDASAVEWIHPTTVLLEGAGIGPEDADQVVASNDAGNGIVTHTFATVVKNGLPSLTGKAGFPLVANTQADGYAFLAPGTLVGSGLPVTDYTKGNVLIAGTRPAMTWATPHATVLSGLPAITGHGGNTLTVNAGETGLEWKAGGGTGTGGGITATGVQLAQTSSTSSQLPMAPLNRAATKTFLANAQGSPFFFQIEVSAGTTDSTLETWFGSDWTCTVGTHKRDLILSDPSSGAYSIATLQLVISNTDCTMGSGTQVSWFHGTAGTAIRTTTVRAFKLEGGGGGSSGPSIPNPTVAGKLKHLRVNAAGAAYELADPPIGIPAPATAETGQVLTRNNSGNAQWLDNAGAPFGTGWVKLFEGSEDNIAGSTALDINLTSTTTEAEGFLEAQRDTSGSGPYRQFLWQMAWNIGEGAAEELVQVQATLPGVPLGGSVAQANQPVAYWGAMSSLNSLCNVALKASRTVVNFSTSSCRPDWGNRGSAGNVSLFWKLWGKR